VPGPEVSGLAVLRTRNGSQVLAAVLNWQSGAGLTSPLGEA